MNVFIALKGSHYWFLFDEVFEEFQEELDFFWKWKLLPEVKQK